MGHVQFFKDFRSALVNMAEHCENHWYIVFKVAF